MVKRNQIESKMKSYVDENKFSAFQALYMWSKGLDSRTIAGVLGNQYGSIEGFDIITSDISSLEIRGPSHKIDLTNEEIGVVIRDVFIRHQQPLLDMITKKLAVIRTSEKELLLALIRSSLFEKETIKIEELKIAHHAIFGKVMKERYLMETLSYLEKRGVLYCVRPSYGKTESIIIPEYIYAIQSQIETKLPVVMITEENEES